VLGLDLVGLCVGSLGVGKVEVIVGVVGVEWVVGVVGVVWVEGVEGVVGIVGVEGVVGLVEVVCVGMGEVGVVLTLDELACFCEAFRSSTVLFLNAGKLLWKGLSTLFPCE